MKPNQNLGFMIKKKMLEPLRGVFWLNIAENGVYLVYRYCSKLFSKLRNENEFWQRCCQNSNKKYERGNTSDVWKDLNFGNPVAEILPTRI